jgi:hypothetical protein
MEQATQTNGLVEALELVQERVEAIGFPRISPESLMALGEQLDDESENVCRAYRKVMAGFRTLLAPVEAA